MSDTGFQKGESIVIKHRLVKGLCFSTLAFSLSACSLWQPNISSLEKTIIIPTVLPTCSDLTQSFNAYQHIHVEANRYNTESKTNDFEAMISADQKGMKIAVMAMGMKVWNIDFDGMVITEERSEHLPEALEAQYMVRDIALAYWPSRDLKPQLKDWTLVEGDRTRLIYAPGEEKPIISIEYRKGAAPLSGDGEVIFENHLHHYRLTIQSNSLK